MKNFVKKIVILGAGIAAGVAVASSKRIKQEVNALVKKGKITAKEGQKLMSKIVDDAKKQQKVLEVKAKAQIQNTLKKAGVVTKKQADAMQRKIKQLEKKVNASKKVSTKKAKAAARKIKKKR